MVTFRPIKKWLLPIIAIVLGCVIGYSLFLSKEDHTYHKWIDLLSSFESQTYHISSTYKWGDNIYAQGEGVWSKQGSYYQINTPISDGSAFSLEAYILDDTFYVTSNQEWFTGESPHSFFNEVTPLDNPIQWTKDLLQYADSVTKKQNEKNTILKATFRQFPTIDFRGVLLEQQISTYVTMETRANQLVSIHWVVQPIRPDSVGPFNSYPEVLTYEMTFTPTVKEQIPTLPEGAKDAEEIE